MLCRIPDYAVQFADFNMMSSIGAFILGFSQLIFAYTIIKAIRGGEPATDEVWEGAARIGLEWNLPSPPPYHTFQSPPSAELVEKVTTTEVTMT